MRMRLVTSGTVKAALDAAANPEEVWLWCFMCERFFQYKDALPGFSERDTCPFCRASGFDMHVTLWDDERQPDDPRWPASTAELAYGMSSPDMNVYWDERAKRERLDILKAFCESPEWAALGRTGDVPVWTEQLLVKLWHWTLDPHDVGPDFLRDSIADIYALHSPARPDDAAEILAELRAYFGFAARELEHPGAADCVKVVSQPELPEILADMIEYEAQERERRGRRKRHRGSERRLRRAQGRRDRRVP